MTDVGAWRYAEHPSTEILCFSWQIDGGPTKKWRPPQEFPQEILDHVANGGVIEAHNATFEYAVWYHVLTKRGGLPMPTRWKDTQAVCAYRSLPLKLADVGSVLRLKVQKSDRGKFLIKALCQPNKPMKEPKVSYTKKGELTAASQKSMDKFLGWRKWNNDPALLEELSDYCATDVDTEAELAERIGDLPDDEYKIWLMDQRINKRGVQLDIEAVEAAMALMMEIESAGAIALKSITNGYVDAGTKGEKIKEWCDQQDVWLPDLTADTVEKTLKRKDIPNDVRKVLELRQLLSKASSKKLQRMLEWVCDDGRIRGMLQYHGSGTGRWAGRGPQPQNMPRGDESITDMGMELLIDAIKLRDLVSLGVFYGKDKLADAISSALRGMFIAAPGKILTVGDLSAIEARVLAWVAGEQWKLDAFAGIDQGIGYNGSEDIYLATASSVYGYPCLTKKTHKKERQTGKTCELAFGYQGGVGAWRNFDDSDTWTDAQVDEKKVAWRKGHPNIVSFWYNIEDAAITCMVTGRPTMYRSIRFEKVRDAAGTWMNIILPNGRRLWYFNPRIVDVYNEKTKKTKQQIEYEGRDNKNGGVWSHHIRTYGGMLTENIVQAISRDIMVEAMIRLEKAGYPIVLTVHDEIVCETAAEYGSEAEFKALMEGPCPPWAKGLPLAVGTFRKTRYEK